MRPNIFCSVKSLFVEKKVKEKGSGILHNERSHLVPFLIEDFDDFFHESIFDHDNLTGSFVGEHLEDHKYDSFDELTKIGHFSEAHHVDHQLLVKEVLPAIVIHSQG